MAKQSMNSTYVNVALLFVAGVVYGALSGNMMGNIMNYFTTGDGFMELAINLGPIVAMCFGGRGKVLNYLYFVPLVYNVYSYSASMEGLTIAFCVAAAISFYASIKLAEKGDM